MTCPIIITCEEQPGQSDEQQLGDEGAEQPGDEDVQQPGDDGATCACCY